MNTLVSCVLRVFAFLKACQVVLRGEMLRSVCAMGITVRHNMNVSQMPGISPV